MEVGGVRAIALVRTLVLARLLVPDDFGLLAIALVTGEVAVSLTSFGMREALIQQPAPEERHYETAWTFEVTRALGVAALLMLAAPSIALLAFDEPRAVNLIRFLALVPVVDYAVSIKLLDFVRGLRFRPLATVYLTGSVIHTVVAIAFATSLGVWALAIGFMAGAVSQTIVSYFVAPHLPRPRFDREAAKPLFRFGRWIWITSIVHGLGALILQAVIARKLGAAELGLYFLATRLAFLPSETLRRVVGRVVFPVHATLQSEVRRAKKAYQASLIGMWALLVPTYAIGIALVDGLLAVTVGGQWLGAAPVIRFLALAAVLEVVADGTLPMFQGRGRTEWMAGYHVIKSIAVIGLISILVDSFGVAGAGIAWVAAEILALIYGVRMTMRMMPDAFDGMSRHFVVFVAVGLLIGAVTWGIGGTSVGWVALGAAAVAGGSLSIAMMWWLDRLLKLGFASDLLLAFPSLKRFSARH